MKIIQILTLSIVILFSFSSQAFQLRQHELNIQANQTTKFKIFNNQETTIVIRVTPPDAVQIFPRRVRLLPGESQIIKARLTGTLSDNSRISFSYMPELVARGSHARISLRLPVYEIKP